ncbi:ACT domain-containing protein [uncultured Intestinimonas sp.]|uniref:ACT domain-containing protein n=1 Tax=uncultured Intestinimonas sp. TaxID=1689265 RepID=UPI0025F8F930|nr:ACT domain-containing protein [uncultured Intestinimonas sp.]
MKAIVTVLGKDQVGIIAAVCTLLADNNVNVLDISQTILREFFTMTMLVDLSGSKLPFTVLSTLLENEGARRGLAIKIQREDIFSAMHKI